MVDWSANSSPKRGRDSIWIASGTPSQGVEHVVNPPTRAQAFAWLIDALSASRHERVLAGFDFSFGYPAGFAKALTGQSDATWSDVWTWMGEHLHDDDRNDNNRFEVMATVNARLRSSFGSAPFWGYPGRERNDALPRKRPPSYAPFAEFRLTEQRVRAAGHRPFSAWQLAYNGSVGSQMLLGMRTLQRLRRHPTLAERLRVWPFETGLGPASCTLSAGEVLLAEVWPSMIPFDAAAHSVRDAAQVVTMVRHLLTADARGELASWFDVELTDSERQEVLAEEGWTLGVR